jgi:hypothetical protein
MSDPYIPPRVAPGQQSYGQRPPARQDYRPPAGRYAQAASQFTLTAAEMFWYIAGNIALAAMYFAKVPAKKAMAQAGLCDLTAAESFWYVLMCIAFGAGYFAKIPVAKALSELSPR